jgi:hypothetical protein
MRCASINSKNAAVKVPDGSAEPDQKAPAALCWEFVKHPEKAKNGQRGGTVFLAFCRRFQHFSGWKAPNLPKSRHLVSGTFGELG